MNVEVITQVCDTIAFILITPEIAGEERLRDARAFLDKFSSRLKDILWLKPAPLGSKIVAGLILFVVVSFISIVVIGSVLGKWYPILEYIYEFDRVVWIIFGILIVTSPILTFTQSFIVRGRLLVLGFALFFASRMISIWLAVHHP